MNYGKYGYFTLELAAVTLYARNIYTIYIYITYINVFVANFQNEVL